DNTPMAASELIQVDVYVRHRSDINARIMCKELDNRIKEIIWGNLGMYNTSNSKTEYNVDFKLYRRASRIDDTCYYEKKLDVIELKNSSGAIWGCIIHRTVIQNMMSILNFTGALLDSRARFIMKKY